MIQWEQEMDQGVQFQQFNYDPKMFTFEVNYTMKKVKTSLNTMALLSFADKKEAKEFKDAIGVRKKQVFLRAEKPSGMSNSMNSLLKHNVAHSTSHSFRPKANNQPIKKLLSLAFS